MPWIVEVGISLPLLVEKERLNPRSVHIAETTGAERRKYVFVELELIIPNATRL